MKNYLSRFLPLLLLLSSPIWAADLTYHSIQSISMGGQGGWDYLSVDSEAHRLYVSHADRVVVIDTEAGKVIKEIPGTPGIHGIAVASELKKAFSSDGKEGQVGVIDLDSLSMKNKIKVGENPDAIAYDPAVKKVYAFNGKSHSASIIDAKSEKVLATVALPGKPEYAVDDAENHRMFVNIEDKNEIVALDTVTDKIASTWALEGCESPSGLAMDQKNHRLFSVCENEKMVMVDSLSGKTLASVPTGQGTDGAGFDSASGLAFSSNGKSGTLTVVREDSPGKIAVAQNAKTQLGARTIAVDSSSHRVYLPTADFKAGESGARPKPVDGTQKILVFGP